MALLKSKGNMYTWVTHTWSPIKGCQYNCDYCYLKKFGYDRGVKIDEEDLKTRLGRDKIIFVGHLCDMWGPWIDNRWIGKVLDRCAEFQDNEYIFQSKNPKRFLYFEFGGKARVRNILRFMLGTTIETDKYPQGFKTQAPPIWERQEIMKRIGGKRLFVTIEPIMKFNLYALVRMISDIHPEFVTIGADSKGHGLIEPSWEGVDELIQELSRFTKIRQKTNLERLKR